MECLQAQDLNGRKMDIEGSIVDWNSFQLALTEGPMPRCMVRPAAPSHLTSQPNTYCPRSSPTDDHGRRIWVDLLR